MSSEQWIALLAVVVAALALVATTVLARALWRLRADVRSLTAATYEQEAGEPTSSNDDVDSGSAVATEAPDTSKALDVVATTPILESAPDTASGEMITREGRVVVVPSTQQVVEATLGKRMIRGAVLQHGIRYALRPESRDRLRGMVRREYRRRRRIRLRAGRRAARAASIPPRDTPSWLGTSATRRANVEDDGGS